MANTTFSQFFPAAGSSTGGGGGTIINGITASTPYTDLSYAPVGLYQKYNINSPSINAVNTSTGLIPNTVITTPDTAYTTSSGGLVVNTLANFTTADSPNGGAITFAQANFKSRGNGVVTCVATALTFIITIDGVTTTYATGANVFSGTSIIRTADHASFILGALPVTGYVYNEEFLSNRVGFAAYGGGLVNQGASPSGNKTLTPYYLNNDIGFNANAPGGNRWFGYGLPWIQWTTNLNIQCSMSLSAIDSGGAVNMGGSVGYKHFG